MHSINGVSKLCLMFGLESLDRLVILLQELAGEGEVRDSMNIISTAVRRSLRLEAVRFILLHLFNCSSGH